MRAEYRMFRSFVRRMSAHATKMGRSLAEADQSKFPIEIGELIKRSGTLSPAPLSRFNARLSRVRRQRNAAARYSQHFIE